MYAILLQVVIAAGILTGIALLVGAVAGSGRHTTPTGHGPGERHPRRSAGTVARRRHRPAGWHGSGTRSWR